MLASSRRRPCTSLRTLLQCRKNHGWDRSTPDYDERSPTSTNEPEPPRNSIHIKCWDMIGSLAEAYAIIRAVERKYGRLREYRFWRDFERPQLLQNRISAVFQSPESFKRVPVEGEVLHIPAPPVDPDQDGGLALEDLRGLLVPQDVVETTELPGWGTVMTRVLQSEQDKASRMLDVKVERARRNWVYRSALDSSLPTRSRLLATGHAFLDWGGFYDHSAKPAVPSKVSSTTEQSSMFQSPSDRHMQKTIQKWTEFIGRPMRSDMGSQPTPESQTTTDVADAADIQASFEGEPIDPPTEWDPIPDPPLPVEEIPTNVEEASFDIPDNTTKRSLRQ